MNVFSLVTYRCPLLCLVKNSSCGIVDKRCQQVKDFKKVAFDAGFTMCWPPFRFPTTCGSIHWDLKMSLSTPAIFNMLLSHCVTLFVDEPFSPIRAATRFQLSHTVTDSTRNWRRG